MQESLLGKKRKEPVLQEILLQESLLPQNEGRGDC